MKIGKSLGKSRDLLSVGDLLGVGHHFPWSLHSGKHQHKSEYYIP